MPNTQVPSFVYFANLPQHVKEPTDDSWKIRCVRMKLIGTPINIYIRRSKIYRDDIVGSINWFYEKRPEHSFRTLSISVIG